VVLSEALDESKLDLVEVFLSLAGGPANVSTYESVLLAAANKRDLVFAERRGHMESCNGPLSRIMQELECCFPLLQADAEMPTVYAKRRAFETSITNIGRTTL